MGSAFHQVVEAVSARAGGKDRYFQSRKTPSVLVRVDRPCHTSQASHLFRETPRVWNISPKALRVDVLSARIKWECDGLHSRKTTLASNSVPRMFPNCARYHKKNTKEWKQPPKKDVTVHTAKEARSGLYKWITVLYRTRQLVVKPMEHNYINIDFVAVGEGPDRFVEMLSRFDYAPKRPWTNERGIGYDQAYLNLKSVSVLIGSSATAWYMELRRNRLRGHTRCVFKGSASEVPRRQEFKKTFKVC